jgi:hypothetical protein
MQVVSYAMVPNIEKRARGCPRGFIPDEALDRDRRSFRAPRSRVLGGEVEARDLDDGLPRGFLAGAIVEVWVALRLNWACELPLSRGEELP